MHATRATRPLDEDDAPCDGPHTAESPYLAPVTRSKLMTDPASDRRVLHLEFDLTAAKRAASLAYEPGDSIGVLPRNDPELVSELASRLGLSLESSFDLTWASEHASANQNQNQPPPLPNVRRPCVVGDVLSRSVDITSVPRKSLLRALAEACAESEDRLKLLHLCSRGGRDAYKREMVEEAPTLVDLLTTIAPSCAPDLATLLDALTPLQPRMYSITTAPEAHPGKPAVAFSVVSFQTPQGAARRGVATHWLDRSTTRGADASSSFRCPVFIKRSIAFRPPEDLSTPMLMIGPGTGVAPFRGFLQRRAAMIDAAKKKAARDGEAADVVAPGNAFLFFGCRAPTEDFLYRDEFEAFAADGTLTKLITAFSRENPDQPKVYVQHKIREHAAAVAALIVSSDDARVYVCGDGGGMAKDVHAALCEVIASHGGVEGVTCAEDAGKMLAEMTKAGRYVRDIWS
jgi:NADPH-ferrihemoprotein reductase